MKTDTVSLLDIQRLNKSFGDKPVLKNVDVNVEQGKTLVIVGPSGSGKSTLLRCMNLLEPIESGVITFEGRDIATPEARREAWRFRQEMAMVFQHFELFPHLSVIDNIMLAPVKIKGVPKAQARQKALELLERVRIPDKANAWPEELSGGQQQRVAIARALAMEPRVMLFDEPTSALDPEMIKEVLDVMTELSDQGMTSVVVTHEMSFARRAAHRVVFMADGEVVENLPTDQFFGGEVKPRTRQFLDQILH
ncbi:amino acid ABC transporter ATP-binding protein [Salinicola rhizosphaerae]|uniref:Amino acid ABC transporter ATPase n=1 Tax=Salinicola rhizosphaerae TaxID=1443141 RepID=A0ABQ3DSS4_9GAMM|nr:amino acid ABC transporter ATP-binding protein [Salinicola rhizosphaerae]GHB14596.1 amino acid ABC transporter ATPase [Salinicola rhizosphaerae]